MPGILPYEQYCICPYNQSHHVLPTRFGNHLMKCKKQYSGKDVVDCEFGCQHIRVEKMEEHLKSCKMKREVEALKKELAK